MLKIYNTLQGEKEDFKPLEPGKVKIYVCGLTVQNYSHLGHIRSAVNYDVIRRYLEYKGYEVIYVQNFTDINEKILARAREEGLTPVELADKYRKAYLEDIEKMNIQKATHYASATENINEIINMVDKLIKKGYAYEVDGNVYFSVKKFKDYGKLSGRSLDEMQAGARIEIKEDKQNPMDFALWKKVEDNKTSWDSPWGKGWPGWHIECSAMSMKYLGESFDIHGGGTDLVFPHHENEIAQSEACTGKPFARYWLHNGTVNLKGEKMSKSLGNFFTTRELLRRFNPEEIRYFLLTKHYRTPINFDLEEMEQAGASLKRLVNTVSKMKKVLTMNPENEKGNEQNRRELETAIKTAQMEFEEAMDDDFNSARAIGVLHQLATDINSLINDSKFVPDRLILQTVKEGYGLFHELAGVLGLPLEGENGGLEEPGLLNDLVDFILEIREEARRRKDWELADRVRDRLKELGFTIKDTPLGVEWERNSEN